VTLGRAVVLSLGATAALAVVAAFSGSYAGAVAAALAAGISGLAAAVCGTLYVLTAFFGRDRRKAEQRRKVLAALVAVGAVALLCFLVYGIVQALQDAG
jgi:hypothetical protein